MTAYRDPMSGPFADAAAAALHEADMRQAAREARWQEGRAEALRAIAEFNAAAAPAKLAYDVDARRNEWTTLYCNFHKTCIVLDRVRWGWTDDDEGGWRTDQSGKQRLFAHILLDRMKHPTFQDEFAKMQQAALRSRELEAPIEVIVNALASARDEDRLPAAKRSTVIHVVGSVVLGLELCGAGLVLAVLVRYVIGLFG